MKPFESTDINYNLLYVKEGIAYFEGGYWMLDSDRWENEKRRKNFEYPQVRLNKETKQIELDRTIYP
jgi:hypothetical protein